MINNGNKKKKKKNDAWTEYNTRYIRWINIFRRTIGLDISFEIMRYKFLKWFFIGNIENSNMYHLL